MARAGLASGEDTFTVTPARSEHHWYDHNDGIHRCSQDLCHHHGVIATANGIGAGFPKLLVEVPVGAGLDELLLWSGTF